MSIHPQIIEKEGKKEFVVLPYEEFLAIKESLEDFEDLKEEDKLQIKLAYPTALAEDIIP